ncbi:glycosyltransferase family 4 protein [Candidatus Parcubacteria bacterium]|nr:glycosyltransferase family 4 protein [Candidatus Parcubacteria bacterium]
MKILYIIDSLGLGGAQTVVKGIFEKQQENKDIFLYALRKRKINININHKNVFVSKSKNKYSLFTLIELKRLIEKEKIDVLHCHLFKAQFFGWLLNFFFSNIKLIQHEHGQIFQGDFYYNKFINISQKKTDLFIAVSKAIRNKLIECAKVDSNKIKVLYNFVDLDKFSNKLSKEKIFEKRKKLGIKKDEFVVGFAGRLIERKGWREFIKTAKILNEKKNDFKFLVAGDGPQKKELLNLVKRNNFKDKMRFLGYQKNILEFYSLLDCFVISSYWEGLPMAQLEIMSFGIPLIISDGPGMNEITVNGKECIYTKVKNVNSIKTAVVYLLGHPNFRNKLIKNSLNKVKEYSLIEYIKKINSVY